MTKITKHNVINVSLLLMYFVEIKNEFLIFEPII